MEIAASVFAAVGSAAPAFLRVLKQAEEAATELKQSRSKIHQAHDIILRAQNSGITNEMLQPLIDATENLSVAYEKASQGHIYHESNKEAARNLKALPYVSEMFAWQWFLGSFTPLMDVAQRKVNEEIAQICRICKFNLPTTEKHARSGADSYRNPPCPKPEPTKVETGPEDPPPRFRDMGYVVIHGLKNKAELNHLVGMVVQYEGGCDRRYRVVTGLGDEQFKIREQNLRGAEELMIVPCIQPPSPTVESKKPVDSTPVVTPVEVRASNPCEAPSPADTTGNGSALAGKFNPGSLVQLNGMIACPELNGQVGTILQFCGGLERRYNVLVAGRLIHPREECLSTFRPEFIFSAPEKNTTSSTNLWAQEQPKAWQPQEKYPATFAELLQANPNLAEAVSGSGGFDGMNEGWKKGDARGVVAHLRQKGWPEFTIPEEKEPVYPANAESVPSTSPGSISSTSPSSASTSSQISEMQFASEGPCFAPMSHVVVNGLKKAHELNAQIGQVLSYLGGPDRRYMVLVANKQVSIKEPQLSAYAS